MSAWLALLLAAQPVPGDAASDQAMLDAFRAACRRIGDLDHLRADIVAAGFTEVPANADPRLDEINRAFGGVVGDDGRLIATNFSATIGGRRLYLYLSRFEEDQGGWGHACRLHDFEAAAPLDGRLLERWMGRPPTQVDDQGEIGLMRIWQPAWGEDTTLQVIHVPQARREEPAITGTVVGVAMNGDD